MSDSFDKALTSALEEHIKRPFVCGGTIDIGPGEESNKPEKQNSTPINVFWVTDEDTAVLKQLVKDCEPATFGKGQEDVHDPEYRNAGKMDPNKFATTFHPADFDGNQIGSLVVCLPSKFKGGKFKVQHAGQHSGFDWSSKSDSTIQWVAFYSDCEHEIETVTEGERITLTYNLYITEPSGVLGFYCTHAYPYNTKLAEALLPRGLKGGDLMMYAVLQCLGVKVKVLPEEDEYERREGKIVPTRPQMIGKELHDHDREGWQVETYDEYVEVLDRFWKNYHAKYITWISDPKHAKLALTYIAYGNEASVGTVYSHAAILAVIPPFDERNNLG
ncbi:hypothetical protein BDW69DRAFT_199901 [Aspergillus filifer]